MKTGKSLSIGIIRRIVFIALVLIILLGVGVFAGNQSVNTITIQFSDGTELSVITSKQNVNDILKENNIYIFETETVTPDFSENVGTDKTIKISRKTDEEEKTISTPIASEVLESNEVLTKEDGKIVEKIVKETVEIPFETITKEVSSGNGEKTNKVLQEGQNGIKEITYKVKYQNDVEIERNQISEEVIQEPVDKIIQVTASVSSRAATAASRIQSASYGTAADAQNYARTRCSDYGWSENDYNSLVVLWNRESGWNMNAINRSSGAAGIPQALGHTLPSNYYTSYEAQVEWGLNYIRGRYGNPTNALAHSNSTGWY